MEVPLVLGIQSATPASLEAALKVYTEWIHPTVALTVVFPLLLGLGRRAVALHLALTFCTSDVANLLLKCTLAGDRPYWASPSVRQFPMTCEGGFGMPSGHLQAFTAVSYFLLARLRASYAVFGVHAFFVIVGAYSRVYTGSHFPSQTLLGWAVGAAFGLGGHRLLRGQEVAKLLGPGARPARRAGALAGFAAACAAAMASAYVLLELAGRDPLASLAHARAACHSARGVLGLVFETASGLFGVLLGVAAVSLACPCTDGMERMTPVRCVLAALGVVAHQQAMVRLKGDVGAFGDGPDGPRSVFIALVLGFSSIVLAAPLSLLPLLPSLALPKLR